MPWKVGSSDVVSGSRPRRAGKYGGLRKMAEVDWGCDGSMEEGWKRFRGSAEDWKRLGVPRKMKAGEGLGNQSLGSMQSWIGTRPQNKSAVLAAQSRWD